MQDVLTISLSVAFAVIVYLVVLRVRHVKTYRLPERDKKRIVTRTILTGVLLEASLLWVLTATV